MTLSVQRPRDRFTNVAVKAFIVIELALISGVLWSRVFPDAALLFAPSTAAISASWLIRTRSY